MRRVFGIVNMQEKGGLPHEVCIILYGVLCPYFSHQASFGLIYKRHFRKKKARIVLHSRSKNLRLDHTVMHSVKLYLSIKRIFKYTEISFRSLCKQSVWQKVEVPCRHHGESLISSFTQFVPVYNLS